MSFDFDDFLHSLLFIPLIIVALACSVIDFYRYIIWKYFKRHNLNKHEIMYNQVITDLIQLLNTIPVKTFYTDGDRYITGFKASDAFEFIAEYIKGYSGLTNYQISQYIDRVLIPLKEYSNRNKNIYDPNDEYFFSITGRSPCFLLQSHLTATKYIPNNKRPSSCFRWV